MLPKRHIPESGSHSSHNSSRAVRAEAHLNSTQEAVEDLEVTTEASIPLVTQPSAVTPAPRAPSMSREPSVPRTERALAGMPLRRRSLAYPSLTSTTCQTGLPLMHIWENGAMLFAHLATRSSRTLLGSLLTSSRHLLRQQRASRKWLMSF